MHMADALISPAVGGTMLAAVGVLIAWSARKVKQSPREDLIPLMGVLGAFVFAAQMINFAIPLTGSSGHIGGGLLLSILLGPHAAFLVIASVLTVQSLFFADGGLLSLGCNIFNLAFFPALIAYPLLYRPLAALQTGTLRSWTVTLVSAVIAVELGALGVVVETTASGISELPFRPFLLLMLPIHLAIGLVEGAATAAVVSFVAKARPGSLAAAQSDAISQRRTVIGLGLAAALIGGVASWFASSRPDGLEWSIAGVTGIEELAGAEDGIHKTLAEMQEKTAILPDYGFKEAEAKPAEDTNGAEPWPVVNAGTSLSGIAGGAITLALVLLVGLALKAAARRKGIDPKFFNQPQMNTNERK